MYTEVMKVAEEMEMKIFSAMQRKISGTCYSKNKRTLTVRSRKEERP